MKTLILIFKILLIAVLCVWCMVYGYGFWSVTNWYELLIAFLALLFIPALVLFFVAHSLLDDPHPVIRKIGGIGLTIGALSIILPLCTVALDAYRWYVDGQNYQQYVDPNLYRLFPSLRSRG